ncbi:MAG TPA: excinuclease ABC subunit UvrA, partial [Armatimonadetes bacterium]|nr:excinuclease ABC subunit UvrA [Armatimonadota bacterium]
GARAFLGQMEKPDVDHIEGLSPAISIEQKAAGHNPRSTVATMTEIYDYLRVLYARVGTPHCVRCGSPIGAQTSEEIIDRILQLPPGTRFQILAPIAQGRKGEFRDVFEEARRAGFVRVRVDGEILDLAEDIRLDRQRRHDIDLVIDRLVMKEGLRSRLADSVELALERGEGQLILNIVRLGEGTSPFAEGDLIFSRAYACLHCRQSYSEPTPQLFSFNSPQGMCPVCQGLGQKVELVPDLAVPDPSKSINEGAIVVWGEPRSPNLRHILEGLARHFHFSLDQPWETLSEEQQNVVLYGTNERLKFVYVSSDGRRYPYWDTYRGVLATYERKLGRTRSKRVREWVGQFIKPRSCPACGGARLRPEALAVTVGGKSIAEVTALTVAEAAHFFDTLELNQRQAFIAQDLLKEIRGRLHFLLTVGLHYLTLDRTAPTLSSGESQRIRLASQIGAGLVGVLYILDEPSIGLHPRDNKHLLATLKRLRDLGNTVIVAEHDEETMRAADFLVDFGPGPGRHGGEVVATGSAEEVARNPRSLTGQYLAGKRRIPIPQQRRRPADKWLLVRGARHHNLKSLDVAFPLGLFICVTGVSGSGKSSLVNDILYYALARDLNGAQTRPGAYTRIEGLEHLDKVIAIDQSPIGRTPRSNPATYTKALDPIRHLFAQLPEARARGYDPGRFSFNVPHKGRCEACEGYGWQRIEMDFLADVWVKCEVCGGTRFNRETLEVRYRGKNIAEVLEMTVAEALEHFAEIPSVRRVLQTLHDVGLDYIQLGQPAPTLSGGEAQRVKLARELAKRSTGRTLYILDEPTTGLHFADIQKLLEVLNRFVNQGNTVIVVEHNMEMVKCADYLIDLGPEGGEEGGYIVAAGPPEEVARNERSYTGRILREVLADGGKQKGEIPEIQADGQAQRRDRGAEVVEMTDVRTSPTPTPQPLNSLPEPFEPLSHILVRGAREHNLQGIDARIPREQMTIFTGVSGSGKTSLALDTIYAEGQRRYVESLSAYARQFINQLEKPRVDYVAGLSPAISIDQKSASPNPRSTVGTVTEVYDYLRILFARLGERYCVQCGGRVGAQTPDEMVERILQLPEGTRIYLLSPLILGRTEEYAEAFARARRDGFVRVRVDGQIRELGEEINIDRRRKHEVEIVVDRLVVRPDLRSRLADSVELALDKSGGTLLVQVMERGTRDTGQGARDLFFSQHCACQQCGESYEELTPQSFSFNSPLGWCPVCEGLGVKPGLDPGLIVPDERKSVREGAFAPWPGPGRNRQLQKQLEEVCLRLGIDPDVPLQDLPEEQRQMLLYGTGDGGGEAGIQPR